MAAGTLLTQVPITVFEYLDQILEAMGHGTGIEAMGHGTGGSQVV